MARWLAGFILTVGIVGTVGQADSTQYGAPAAVRVSVPVGATLTIDGIRTHQMTAIRQFVSPPLPHGRRFVYTFKAEYTDYGERVARMQQVEVWANAVISIDLEKSTPVAPPQPPPPPPPESQWTRPEAQPTQPKVEPAKPAPPKIDLPKIEPKDKPDTPKIDLPKIEPKDKPDTPKIDLPKIDLPKIEPKDKPDTPKIDLPKVEPAKPAPPKIDLPKIDIPKVEPAKPAPPKIDLPKIEPKDKPDTPEARIKPEIEVPFVPTPNSIVHTMLKLAQIQSNDVVFDLGCGDGRIPITAVKKYQARKGMGIDFNPDRVKESRENARKEGPAIEAKLEFRTGDVLKLTEKDFAGVDVVTLYLLPEVNQKLRPILQKGLKPGARVISHDFDMGEEWMPDEVRMLLDEEGIEHIVYLWKVKKN